MNAKYKKMRVAEKIKAILEFVEKGGEMKSKEGNDLIMNCGKMTIRGVAKESPAVRRQLMELIIAESFSSPLRKKLVRNLRHYPRIARRKEMHSRHFKDAKSEQTSKLDAIFSCQ